MGIVEKIVTVIVIMQVVAFAWNIWIMWQFGNIFAEPDSWRMTLNGNQLVNGVDGKGNKIFTAIIVSINKYLGSNAGSVIDFALLKDAVDRQCDTEEDSIAVLTPVPLYLGLIGTMFGIFFGLRDLLQTDAINTLMAGIGDETDVTSAANGVDGLLHGVKWAMLASVCGIMLTTFNSLLFKKIKSKEGRGKDSFLAWMQSVLLPALPTDTSSAMNLLARNLNRFNSTFSANIASLGNSLGQLDQISNDQMKVVKTVQSARFAQMADANVKVLEELKDCTSSLERFNGYLASIQGYTDAIHKFEAQFSKEANRVAVLEEIAHFFRDYKGSISKVTGDADDALGKALDELKNASSDGIIELKARMVEQSDTFKTFLKQESEAFESMAAGMRKQFEQSLAQMPGMQKQLDEVSKLPTKMEELIKKVNDSNDGLAKRIEFAMTTSASQMRQAVEALADVLKSGGLVVGQGICDDSKPDKSPRWKWVKVVALIAVAVACIVAVVMMI